MFSIYEKGDISPRLNDDVLKDIMNTDLISNAPQKVFAYCYLGVISYLTYNNKYSKQNIRVEDIKEYLGYAKINKKVNFIIKKGGVLEEMGLISNIPNPSYIDSKNHVKVPKALDELSDCHTFNLKLFFSCMNNPKLNLIGFFIANYIKEFQNNYIYGVRGSVAQISKLLNIPISTVGNYLDELANENLINKNNIRDKEAVGEISIHLRGKLGKWRNDSLEFHNNKCFVSGRTKNLIIHHIVPFNQIRDYVLNSLELSNKALSDFTKEELTILENRFNDYHSLSLGVPLNETIHKQFHMLYGNYATLEELLEYKNEYVKNLKYGSLH